MKYYLLEVVTENITKRGLFKLLPDKLILNLDYFLTFGKLPNLKKPQTFSEKLQWAKLYGDLERFTNYADKYEVRKYVEAKIGESYLIPLVGLWENFEDIDFRKLPEKFVLKATHGSGYNFICKDKKALNINSLKKKVNQWLKESFYAKVKESQYKSIKPRIICEKYMSDTSGGLMDYKIFCYNGQPKYVDVHIGRFTDHRSFHTDINWNRLPIYVDNENNTPFKLPPKPANWEEMVSIAKSLSKGFSFVRVDLYSVKGRTYFGELTFIPATGLLKFTDYGADYFLGEPIDVRKYNPLLNWPPKYKSYRV